MPQVERFEALVFASGRGGKLPPWHLAQSGGWKSDFRTRLPTSAVLRTAVMHETNGSLKSLVSAGHDGILGFTMIGTAAGKVMTAVQAARLANLPYPRLRDAVLGACNDGGRLGSLFSNDR